MSLIGIQRNTHSNTQTRKETILLQRAKNVGSGSPGLVDFVIRLVNSVLNLTDRQVRFFEAFKLQKICESILLKQKFVGLAEMTSGLVNGTVASACQNGKLGKWLFFLHPVFKWRHSSCPSDRGNMQTKLTSQRGDRRLVLIFFDE